MSQWIRVEFRERCGNCGEEIRKGDPALEFRGRPPARWKSFRCGKFECAREAIPENLPELVERSSAIVPQPMLNLGADALPLDFKQRAGGE